MALNTNKDLKLYYSIKEVAETIGVTETLLRYWEREFPQISPHKTSRQIRQYTKKDIETIRQIYLLVKVRGLKLSAAREALRQEQDKEQKSGAERLRAMGRVVHACPPRGRRRTRLRVEWTKGPQALSLAAPSMLRGFSV